MACFLFKKKNQNTKEKHFYIRPTIQFATTFLPLAYLCLYTHYKIPNHDYSHKKYA